MEFTTLLNHFRAVSEEADGGYLALCPAHNDSNPSLRLWRGDDNKVRVTCRAGCESDAVVRAAGLTWPDMFNATGAGATVPKEKPALVGVAAVAGLRVWLDSLPSVDRSDSCSDYALKRFGIGQIEADRLGLRFADYIPADSLPERFLPAFVSRSFARFPRLVVPLNGFDGVTRGAQGRDLSGACPGRWLSLTNPDGMRWAQYGVFRGEGGYGVTLVTEGPGDALTAAAVGYDAVAVRGASLAASPELIAELAAGLRGTQVIVAGDNDTAGNSFTQRLSEGLAAHGIDVYALHLPAAGDDLTAWRERVGADFASDLHAAVKYAKPARSREAVESQHRRAEVQQRTGAISVNDDQGREAARILAELVTTYGESDAMNAHALVAWTAGRIRYAPELGFMVWNGRVWEKSSTKVRQEIHRMGAALVLSGNAQEARGFTMTTRIDALMTELRSVPSVYVHAADFDARTDLLSFANGTVDLRTGRLRPHDKADMLTYALDIDYVPSATCPRWERFLTEIFPRNPELPPYMQRLTGYGITGDVSEQAFAVLWGKGANGKSVFTDTLTSVFRNITRTTGFATFEEKANGGIPNDIAALRGSRLVMASEGEAGKPMSEATLKRATGKEMMQARFLRKEFFEFKPQFLIMLATNHKPRFRGQDDGLWRRVKLIPFVRYFAPHERDYNLDRALLAESEGIAAWAVRGAVEWYAHGLGEPDSITAATQEYRETSDTLAGFFPGIIVPDAGATLNGTDAYNAYRDWCEAEGLQSREVWSRKLFYSTMEERGIQRKRNAKGMVLVGVRLADTPDRSDAPGIFAQ